MNKIKFGAFVKAKRTEHNLTQKELADLLLIDVSAVSKWERGVTYPDITMIPAICKALDLSEQELIESSVDTSARSNEKDAMQYRKLKKATVITLTVCYLVAVVTCFTVNLAVDRRLSWFYLVFSSCLCGYTFVPDVAFFHKRLHLPIYAISTLASTALLYFTVSAYTNQWWCFAAMAGTADLYALVFLPILLVKQKKYLPDAKCAGLKRWFLGIESTALYLLTVLLLFSAAVYVNGSFGRPFGIASYCFSLLFAASIVSLLPISRSLRLSLDAFLTSVFMFGLNGVLNRLIGDGEAGFWAFYDVDFSDWSACSNGNVTVIVCSVFLSASIVLVCFGLYHRKKSGA